jgi:hypothetical protein
VLIAVELFSAVFGFELSVRLVKPLKTSKNKHKMTEPTETLKELKIKMLTDKTLNLTDMDKLGIVICDNKEYLYKLLNKQK